MTVFIPDEKINDIKNAADIVDIVSEVVQLKKAGKNFLGLCPFHSEKTPSFTVSPEKQIFHCFGCRAGGNVFSFLMKHDGLAFPEAARRLAARYGIDLPTRSFSPEDNRRLQEREALYRVNRTAADLYHTLLVDRPGGRAALKYLGGRGIDRTTIDRFKLGLAPPGWDTLVRYLTQKQISLSTAARAGLLRSRQQGGFYDTFRARIVFPIVDTGRQVIGFGGRALDDSPAKYLNTPETPVFNKRRSLYGLDQARQKCRETGTIHVVEGYMDALALFQNGIANVVAVLGTALTPDHVRLIKGYASKAVLVFDSDEAGLKAAGRSITIMNNDIEPRILVLPAGHDPDSYIREFGSAAFEQAAENAMNAIDFLTESAIKTHGLAIEGKVHIISEMKTHLAAIDDDVARLLYIKQLSERLDIEESAVQLKVREVMNRSGGPGAARRTGSAAAGNHRQTPRPAGPMNRIETKLIAMMLQYPDILPRVEKLNVLEYFDNSILKRIGARILELRDDGAGMVSRLLMSVQDPTQKELITSLTMLEESWHTDGCMNLINQFITSRTHRRDPLLQQIKAAEKSNDTKRLIELLKKKQRQLKEPSHNTPESLGGNPV